MEAVKKQLKLDGRRRLLLSIYAVLFVVLFFNAMTMTLSFSFTPELVKSFGASEVEAGSYAGAVAASMSIGQLFFSMFWGYLADVRGRRFSLLLSASLLSLTTLAFGCSYNFYWTFITRLLQGSSSGIVVISKSIIYAYCDDSDLPMGMSVISGSYCFGLILGPSIGVSLLKTLPVLLPNLVATAGLLISIVLVIFVIPNDGELQRHVENSYLIDGKNNLSYGSLEASDRIADDSFFALSLKQDGEESFDELKRTYNTRTFTIVEPLSKNNRRSLSFTKENLKNLKIFMLFRSKDCMRCCLIYGLNSTSLVSYQEIFPVYAATRYEYNGLQLTSSQIGLLIFVVAIFQISISIFAVSKLTVKFGAIKVFFVSMVLMALIIPLTPIPSFIENRYLNWFVVVIVQIVVRISTSASFLCVTVLLNNSVEPDLVGSANGLGMTISCLGKAIGPIVFGVTYSWSLTNVKGVKDNKAPLGFPFNQYFAFIMLAILSAVNGILIITFPRSLEKKKTLVKDDMTNEELAKTKKLTRFAAYDVSAET